MENLSGSTLKGYELQERIGAGGFGAVYKARQTTIDREVAIKIILPGFANRPDFIRRFETEAQLVARLEHLNIVPLYDYWRDPQGAYLVMRWLRGGSLKDALHQDRFDLTSTIRLMEQVTAALSAAHRNQVIHRDIKPGNILLDEDSNAYLADFGIAKDIGLRGDGEVTEPDQIIGSPDYLAPEQARSEAVTPQTDIYSLGVVLYEMLAGAHPFPNLTGVERLFKHLNDPLPLIEGLDPAVQEAVNQIIQKATQKNPAHRYADVLEIMVAFRQTLAARHTSAEGSIVELLTLREQEILQGMIDGLDTQHIAEKFFITISTVRWYIKQIYKKLGVRSRVQAIVRARELNLIVPAGGNGHPTVIGGTTSISHLPAPENPYKGLLAFQPADEQDFFGREKLINKIVTRLGEKDKGRFLAIVGPSGSGKSSLVKAGLLPALWRGEIPGSEKWFVVDMLPGTRPLDKLEVALTRVAANQAANLHEHLSRDEGGLLRVADLILPNDNSELVLIIDQFEEVFTLLDKEDQRIHFLNLLHTAVTSKRSRVRVVVTLRADFYDRPLHYPEFGELIRDHTETVLPLTAKELESAILNPAKRVGVKFEEGLVATIVSEVNYQPGGLPLLQYALTELFENRENRTLTHVAYQKIGGTVGALAKRAEEIFEEFSEEAQETTRQMFLRLVTLGEGVEDTRRRTPRSELAAITYNEELLGEIIDTFAEYRLLSLDHDPATRTPTVEVAHEAILREWERLRNWLNESRADVRMQRQLAHMAEEWRGSQQDKSFLLRGSRLEMFEGWIAQTGLAITSQEREFLQASLTEHERQEAEQRAQEAREAALTKRAQRVLQGLVAVFLLAAVIAGGLALWANSQRNRAEEEKTRAEEAEQKAQTQAAILLAAQAENELEDGYYDLAVLLALEALEYYPYTPQAEHALGQAVSYNRALQQYAGHESAVTSVDWSPDGTKIASSSTDNTVQIWDAATGETLLIIELPTGITGNIYDWGLTVKWTPDSKNLLTVSGDRFLLGSQDYDMILWDAATGKQIKTIEIPNQAAPEQGEDTTTSAEHYTTSTVAAFASQSGRLVSVGGDNTAIVWDATLETQALVLSGHENDVNSVAWSPDETLLATASEDGTARIWDSARAEQLRVLSGHEGAVNQVAWSPDGNQLATAGKDGTIRIWNAETGSMVQTLQANSEIVWSLAWSSDGLYLASGSNDALVRLWEIESGEVVFELSGHQNFVFQVAWSPTDHRLASVGADSTVRIWNAASNAAVLSLPDSYWGAAEVEWSHDGRYLSVPTGDLFGENAPGNLLIWDVSTGQIVAENLARLEDRWYWFRAIFSPDDRLLLGQGGLPWPDVKGFTTAYVFDGRTGEIVREFTVPEAGEDSFIRTSGWSPDGTKVAAGTFSFGEMPGILAVWDFETGEVVTTVSCADGILKLDWSPDGTKIAILCVHFGAEFDSFIQVQDAATGMTVLTIPVDPAEPLVVAQSVSWSPDGTRLLTTGGDDQVGPKNNPVIIWDANTGEKLLSILRHTGHVWWGSWSPSGTRIATGSTDDTVRVWDTQTGAELLTLSAPSNWSSAPAWSPNGDLLAVGTYSFDASSTPVQVFRVWQSSEELIAYAKECCVFRELTPEERAQFGLPPREE